MLNRTTKRILYRLTSVISVIGIGYILYKGLSRPNNGELIAAANFPGLHEVKELKEREKLQDTISGKYFALTTGSEEVMNEKVIMFSWAPDGKNAIDSKVPQDKIVRVIDESKKTPVIQFVFFPQWLEDSTLVDRGYRTSVRNPNHLLEGTIRSSGLDHVTVFISSSNLKEEPALPQHK